MELHKNIKEEIIVAIFNSITLLTDEKVAIPSDVENVHIINIALLCRFIKNDMELVRKTVEHLGRIIDMSPEFHIKTIEKIITQREKVDKMVLSKSNFMDSVHAAKEEEIEIQYEH